jgi:vacuolar-type H+-ATPase subunit F/Vma7
VLRVVAIGARDRVAGFGLAGAQVVVAEESADVHRAWAALEPDVGVVLLTESARDALGPIVEADVGPGTPLLVVLR